MNLELYLIEVIKGKRKGLFASFLRGLLRVISWFYQKIVGLRNCAFEAGLFKRYRPPVPMIISVGNIVAGGTGKTPVTLLIAQEFYNDYQLGILSRGYRSPAEKLARPTILCNGRGPLHSASYCGDEPYLIAQNLPRALVVVGRNRHRAADLAVKAGAQVIILDDGMQHRHLVRDREIVVMDASDPFGQGHFLPRGLLREEIKSLSRASMVVLNHIKTHEQFLEMEKLISHHTQAPIVGAQMQIENVFKLDDTQVGSLKDKRVGIFCGIAQPENFRATVEAAGAIVVAHYFVADHMTFDWDVFQSFGKRCRALHADYILCTEKDRVKLPEGITTEVPIAWLKMKLSLVEGASEWKVFIEKIKIEIARQI